MECPVNAVVPDLVDNRQFTNEMGKALSRPTVLGTPEFMIKAMFGPERAQLLLNNPRVHPVKAVQAGFKYKYENLSSALADLSK